LTVAHVGNVGKPVCLGNVTRIEEETRAMGVIEWLDSVLQDASEWSRLESRSCAITFPSQASVSSVPIRFKL
jgi:hypothetical protein